MTRTSNVERRTCPTAAAAIAVALAVGLPWTTWILGWAPSHGDAVKGNPLLLLLAGGAAIVCCWVAERDLWLGLFGLYMVVRAAVTLGPPLIEAALFLTAGLAVVAAVQRAKFEVRRWAGRLLVIGGALQIGYAAIQWWGYHPLATGLHPVPGGWKPDGTLGNSGFLGAYVAITAPFATAWALPLWAVGLLLSKSVIAAMAAAAALAIRYRAEISTLGSRLAALGSPFSGWSLAAVGAAAMLFAMLWAREFNLRESLPTRLEAYAMAVSALLPVPGSTLSALGSRLLALLFGYGPGSWGILAVPMTNAMGTTGPGYEIPMHSDALQLLFEGGLAAIVLACAWMRTHWRTLLTGPAGAAATAALLIGIPSFPFHVGTLAALGCVVIGLATASREPRAVNESAKSA